MPRLALVVGTRPQLVKAAALLPELRGCLFVDTGQHWDGDMAGSFFDELGLRRPDHSLGLATSRLGPMVEAVARVLEVERPDVVVVIGDTHSTLAAALAARTVGGIALAHVEAGLRSFDRTMPEETARIVVDHLADRLFPPTRVAAMNLAHEGLGSVLPVGDILADVVERFLDPARPLPVGFAPGTYVYATVHRAANRTPDAVGAWCRILAAIPQPVVLALHPGTRLALASAGIALPGNVLDIGPTGYRDSLALQLHASVVVTDSGGVEREAAWLGTPVVLLRDRSEWPECGSAKVGLDAGRATAALGSARRRPTRVEGGAARLIASALGVRQLDRNAA